MMTATFNEMAHAMVSDSATYLALINVVATALLIILLVQRELARASERYRHRREVTALNVLIVPLLVVFCFTVGARLVLYLR